MHTTGDLELAGMYTGLHCWLEIYIYIFDGSCRWCLKPLWDHLKSEYR